MNPAGRKENIAQPNMSSSQSVSGPKTSDGAGNYNKDRMDGVDEPTSAGSQYLTVPNTSYNQPARPFSAPAFGEVERQRGGSKRGGGGFSGGARDNGKGNKNPDGLSIESGAGVKSNDGGRHSLPGSGGG